MMSDRYTPISRTDLQAIVKDYAAVFPGWQLLGGNRFVRVEGPIRQQVGFVGLRYAAYRPQASVGLIAMPSIGALSQFLSVHVRNIESRAHPLMQSKVAIAMGREFKPAIHRAIDVRQVLRLCQAEARPVTNDQLMLAVLHAYLGEHNQARGCCESVYELAKDSEGRRWQLEHVGLANKLEAAMAKGTERAFALGSELGEGEHG